MPRTLLAALAASLLAAGIALRTEAGPAGGRTGDQQVETIPALGLVCEHDPSIFCPADPFDPGYCISGGQGDRILHDVCNPGASIAPGCSAFVGARACVPRVVGVLDAELMISAREIRPESPISCDGFSGADDCIRLDATVRVDVDGDFIEEDSYDTPSYFVKDSCRGSESAPGLRFSDWFPFRNRDCVFGIEPGTSVDEIDFEGMLLPGNPSHQSGSPFTFEGFETELARRAESDFEAPSGSILPTALLDASLAGIEGALPGQALRLDASDLTFDVTNNLSGLRERVYDLSIPVAITRPVRTSYEEQRVAPGGQGVGAAVDADDDVLVVGAPATNGATGLAYVFRNVNGSWTEEQQLRADDGESGDRFGASVAISGDVIVVGAPQHDFPPLTDVGAVYVFRRGPTGWEFQQKLFPIHGETNELFGSVAVDGDVIVVGAPTLSSFGSVYVYRVNGGTWSLEQPLEPSPSSQADDQFGYAVAIEGDRLAVSAFEEDISGVIDAGAVYVYRRLLGAWGVEPGGRLVASDSELDDDFGFDLALSGDRMIIGTLGADAAYVFRRDLAGWSEESILTPPPQVNGFGDAVDIDGELAVVGAQTQGIGASIRQGALYVGRRDAAGWRLERRLTAAQGVTNDVLGSSVAISTRFLIGGARTLTSNGAVHFFDMPDAAPLIAHGSATGGEQFQLDVNGYSFRFEVAQPGGSPDAVAAQLADALSANDPAGALVAQRGVASVTSVGNRVTLFGLDASDIAVTDLVPGDSLTIDPEVACNNLEDDDHDGAFDFDGGLGTCGACAHAPQEEGAQLESSCCPCVARIVAADPYCATTSWDGLCVGAVATRCRADAGCAAAGDFSEQSPLIACDDGLDNDGDELVDLADPGCNGDAAGSTENPDADGDGVSDSSDNCRARANADQRDTDSDGYGNLCDADLDDNGSVGLSDFNVFRIHFGRTQASGDFDPDVDFDGDGAVGLADFNLLRSTFGGGPGPSGHACAGSPPCPP
jgi:hypothetical protein